MLTLEADCQLGPDTQEECETDCQELETGDCDTEYAAFQDCGEGEEVSCTEMGLPTVAGCETEQNAFVLCLTGQ